jgi:hypothetical protein
LYGHIATATGWTFGEIDQLTLMEVNELFDYWQEYPPTHVLVSAYLGGGNQGGLGRRRSRQGAQDLDELLLAVGSQRSGSYPKLPEGYRQS